MTSSARARERRWLFGAVLAAIGCGGAPAPEASLVRNAAPACQAVYEPEPGPAPAMLVANKHLVWIDEVLDQVHSVAMDGGDEVSFRSQEPLGSLYGIVAAGETLLVADASHDSATSSVMIRSQFDGPNPSTVTTCSSRESNSAIASNTSGPPVSRRVFREGAQLELRSR